MVDIIVGVVPPVQNNQSHGDKQRKPKGKKAFKEKRQNKEDRRQGVRDGIVVTLSTHPDRRRKSDRRKQPQT